MDQVILSPERRRWDELRVQCRSVHRRGWWLAIAIITVAFVVTGVAVADAILRALAAAVDPSVEPGLDPTLGWLGYPALAALAVVVLARAAVWPQARELRRLRPHGAEAVRLASTAHAPVLRACLGEHQRIAAARAQLPAAGAERLGPLLAGCERATWALAERSRWAAESGSLPAIADVGAALAAHHAELAGIAHDLERAADALGRLAGPTGGGPAALLGMGPVAAARAEAHALAAAVDELVGPPPRPW